jgi:hypothetical protein
MASSSSCPCERGSGRVGRCPPGLHGGQGLSLWKSPSSPTSSAAPARIAPPRSAPPTRPATAQNSDCFTRRVPLVCKGQAGQVKRSVEARARRVPRRPACPACQLLRLHRPAGVASMANSILQRGLTRGHEPRAAGGAHGRDGWTGGCGRGRCHNGTRPAAHRRAPRSRRCTVLCAALICTALRAWLGAAGGWRPRSRQ